MVDTSVWSLFLRRDTPAGSPEVEGLVEALQGRELVATTGIILQELLQGAVSARARLAVTERFSALEYIAPTRDDHIAAAEVRNSCRAGGVQIGTVDALIAQLCLRERLTLLSTDRDFHHASRHIPLQLWSPP